MAHKGNTVSKRRKTQAAAASGKRGGKTAKKLTDIGRIMEMPLDVLFEAGEIQYSPPFLCLPCRVLIRYLDALSPRTYYISRAVTRCFERHCYQNKPSPYGKPFLQRETRQNAPVITPNPNGQICSSAGPLVRY